MSEDKKIIKKIQQGDSESFGVLYDKYIRKIYDFIYYKVQHRETAEDLTALVFMKALDNIKRFQSAQGSFQAWLYKIARNTVIDHYRTKKHDLDIADAWDLSADVDMARDFDVKDKIKNVHEYLSKLKAEQRDVLIMRIWQGLSHKEIAEILQVSEASVKMKYLRLIKKLRQEMPLEAFLALLFFHL